MPLLLLITSAIVITLELLVFSTLSSTGVAAPHFLLASTIGHSRRSAPIYDIVSQGGGLQKSLATMVKPW